MNLTVHIDADPSSEGRLLRLRPLKPADIDAWYRYLSMPQVVEHSSWNLACASDLQPLLATFDPHDPRAPMRFAIVDGNATFVGAIGFHTISADGQTAEIAYDLDPAYWGRGIATACCQAVVAWGFERRGYACIHATALDSNAATARVLQKCGFSLQGKLPRYRRVRGVARDYWLYSKLRPGACAT